MADVNRKTIDQVETDIRREFDGLKAVEVEASIAGRKYALAAAQGVTPANVAHAMRRIAATKRETENAATRAAVAAAVGKLFPSPEVEITDMWGEPAVVIYPNGKPAVEPIAAEELSRG